MPFLDPKTGHLNMKIALFGPDPEENARRLRAAHAPFGEDVRLRQVNGDGQVFPAGASVLFFDAPLPFEPLFGHPLHLHLYAFEGDVKAEHLAVLLLGVDGVVHVPGAERTPAANLENLRAYLKQARHALPTVVVQAEPGESHQATIDRAVASVRTVFAEHLANE